MAINFDILEKRMKERKQLKESSPAASAQENEKQAEGVTLLPASVLQDHPLYRTGSPFHMATKERIDQLAESIRTNGILNPLLVRPHENGNYQLLTGHGRKRAAVQIGYQEIPCIIMDVDDDEARDILVTDNLMQRPGLLPSEKAFAYKMKLEAMKHQGKRSDLTSDQSGPKLNSGEPTSRQVVGKLETANMISNTDSGRQVQRYIRLTYLLTELLDMVDDKRIGISVGVELSHICQPSQQAVIDYMAGHPQAQITMKIAKLLRETDEDLQDAMTEEILDSIFNQKKTRAPRVLKLQLKGIRQYFPGAATDQEMTAIIADALAFYYEQKKKEG